MNDKTESEIINFIGSALTAEFMSELAILRRIASENRTLKSQADTASRASAAQLEAISKTREQNRKLQQALDDQAKEKNLLKSQLLEVTQKYAEAIAEKQKGKKWRWFN